MCRNMMKPVYNSHAVKRLVERRISVDAIDQIAQVGVTVQESESRVMKRGDLNGKPIHVVLAKPNTVITVYTADEWVQLQFHENAPPEMEIWLSWSTPILRFHWSGAFCYLPEFEAYSDTLFMARD